MSVDINIIIGAFVKNLLGSKFGKLSKTLMQTSYTIETYQIEHSTCRKTKGR